MYLNLEATERKIFLELATLHLPLQSTSDALSPETRIVACVISLDNGGAFRLYRRDHWLARQSEYGLESDKVFFVASSIVTTAPVQSLKPHKTVGLVARLLQYTSRMYRT